MVRKTILPLVVVLVFLFISFKPVLLTEADSTEPEFCDAETCSNHKRVTGKLLPDYLS
jgi:hypothetical protein